MTAPPPSPKTERRQTRKVVDGVTLINIMPGEWRVDGSWIGWNWDAGAGAWLVITGTGQQDWFFAKTHRRAVAILRHRGLIPGRAS